MSVVFDPFTGQIIDTGSSGGAPSIGGPVLGADPNAILITDGATNLSDVQLADGEILIGKTGDAPLATTITGTTNQVDVTNGPNTITLSTPQDIDSTASPTFANLNLGQNVLGSLETIIDISSNVGPADTLNIGITNSDIINIGNAGAQVNIYGNTVYQNVTNLNVTDKNITVNVGGSSGSSFNAGIHVEEDVSGTPTVVGYAEVNALRDGWNFKAPLGSGIANIIPGNTGFTIDQGSHNPITIATPANGLAIDDPYNQELSIALADSSTTGALSSTDFNTFNNKQDRIISKVKAYDLVSSTLPVSAPITVDGHSITTGDAILFGALSAGNNKIYVATVSGVIITWTEDTEFVPNINDYVAVEYGNSFAQRLGVFDGTSFKFNETVRYFNGNDYFEQSALYTTNIDPSTTATVFSLNVANSENIIMDYSIVRGSNKTTGTLYITANSGAVEISDVGVDLNSSPSGVSFSGSVSMGVLTLSYISDVAGSGFLKYNIRRWSDFAGGPGGPPSYSGGGGGTASIAIEQVSAIDPTIPFSNINTIQFDHDTGFNVESVSSGVVKVSLGSSFKTWNIDNGAGPVAGLEAVGEDTMTFVAGSGIQFQADNTLGSKTLTINSTGGGSSAQTVTLSNGITNGNVTGFVVDPLTSDAFTADVVIKRNIPQGLSVVTTPLSGQGSKILQLQDGSALLFGNFNPSNPKIVKLNSDGTLNSAFAANMILNGGFINSVNDIIDVTEDPTNQVLAVFGIFNSFQGLTRNYVCFIDGDGNDIPDLYDKFGISSGGTGFNGPVSVAIKIKYPTNITGSTSPFGYLINGSFTELNGNTLIGGMFNTVVVSNEQGGGYENPNIPSDLTKLKTANKQTSTCPFTYGAITLPSISWSSCEQFYGWYVGATQNVTAYDFVSMPITVITPFGGMGSPIIYDLDTNYDGSVIFCTGVFSSIQDTVSGLNPSVGLCRLDVPSFGITDVNNTWSTTNPLNIYSPACYDVSVSETTVAVSGSIFNPVCNNFLIFNYDATLNISELAPYGTGFSNFVYFFSSNFYDDSGALYKLDPASPNTYMTTMYGCYDDNLASLVIQGYIKTAGLSAGVSFDIDSSGQVKYTSSNVTGGTNFTMKYRLTTL